MTRSVTLAALLALATAASPTAAVPLKFTISGDYDATFFLDTAQTPDFALNDYAIAFAAVDGFANSTNGKGDVQFFNALSAGGLLVVDNGNNFDFLFDAGGPQLYSGLEESGPSFLLGTFALTGVSTPGNFSITIQSLAAVPEPASWAMMIGGLAFAGAAMRRRRHPIAVRFQTA